MAIAARIKKLNFRQIFMLSGAFLFNPLFILPTWNATKTTIRICDENFGNAHHKNNRSNAFRHALWNYLICEHCFRISKSIEKVTAWSRKITDLHEKLFQNKELSRQMDLHNNHIGRTLFENHISKELDIVTLLKQMMTEAKKIGTPEDIKKTPDRLVFIEN